MSTGFPGGPAAWECCWRGPSSSEGLGELRGKTAAPEVPPPGTTPWWRRWKTKQGILRPRNLVLGLIGLLIVITLIIWLTRSSSSSQLIPHPSTTNHKSSPSP